MIHRQIELTAIVEKDEDMFVSFCPELDIASQGETKEEARANLIEALELFFEEASETEIQQRLEGEREVSRVLVQV
jgi:predicted RNase H-like HicB family nuclease